MRTWTCRWASVACFMGVLILPFCASADEYWDPNRAYPGKVLTVLGTVYRVHLGFEVFAVRDSLGGHYHPINLPRAFWEEGTEVEMEVPDRPDIAELRMNGAVVELVRIRHR